MFGTILRLQSRKSEVLVDKGLPKTINHEEMT